MNDIETTVSMLKDQCARRPALTVQDLVKALYQSQFGCGHFVSDREKGMHWLRQELMSLPSAPKEDHPPFIEPLGNAFCRIHLARLEENGLAPETLFSLFALSAEAPTGGMDEFLEKLALLENMIRSGELPVEPESAQDFLSEYRASGCPATHHSDAFRAAYSPAYRVIRSDYARYLPLFCAVDRMLREKERIIVAIEGGSASGKSTLGALMEKVYGCNLFHMDDFFLQKHQRTPERFRQPGGNVDYERFFEEVTQPLLSGKPFSYRLFDCSTMSLGEYVSVEPKRLSVVEGAYSMHPSLRDAYDLSAFLSIDPSDQAARILRRNGEAMQKRFLTEWIPLEHRYFDALNVRESCTMIL